MLCATGARFLALVVFYSLAWAAPLGSPAAAQSVSDAVLLEFSSERCGYCKKMQPVLNQLQATGVPIRHVDVDQEVDMAVRFGIKQLPTFVVVVAGKEAQRLVGMQKLETLQTAIATSSKPNLTNTNSQLPAAARTRLSAVIQQPQFNQPPQLASRQTPEFISRPASAADSYTGKSAGTPMPGEQLQQAVARAQAATVRLRVFDGDGENMGYGVGTGTIIDRHNDEYLVLTCGHLFRESAQQPKIEVDLFINGSSQTVRGYLVDFDAGKRDIALVSLRYSQNITPVPVLGDRSALRVGDSAFSFGCDRGADPSLRDTRISGIDKYNQHLGVSNLEIAGAPVDGRSGGGLFNREGQLIGVCNSADFEGDIGIYAGPGEVRWQLGRVGLTNLLDAPATNRQITGNQFASTNGPQPAAMSPEPAVVIGTRNSASSGGDQEMIIILRNRNQPEAPTQVKVIAQPPAHLLDLLRSH
ncbi:trypsin-like peptidase domain-containing protein [Planctomycetaceae bacterium SH139]